MAATAHRAGLLNPEGKRSKTTVPDLNALTEQERRVAADLWNFFRLLLSKRGGDLRIGRDNPEKTLLENLGSKYDNIEYEEASCRGSAVSGTSLYSTANRAEQEKITSRVAQEVTQLARGSGGMANQIKNRD